MSFIKAFEDEFLSENSEVFKHVMLKMIQIWKQLGVPDSKIQERVIAATSQNKERWGSMLEKEQNYCSKIVSTVDRLARQHHQLCQELGTPYIEFGEEIPLLDKEKLLQETLMDLIKEKEERTSFIRGLFQEEDVLCQRLNVERCGLNRECIPSPEQCTMLQEVITRLKTELGTREKEFVTMRDSVFDSMVQLEISARSSFEMEVLLSDPQSVSLSETYLDKIKELELGLISHIQQNRSKVNQMWPKLKTLWERLSMEEDTQEIFQMENRGFSPSTVRSLERELARLEVLKRQNIERFIHDVRQDLISWWDRCYVSDAERRTFTPFDAEVFTEDLLELHTLEVEKYKALHTSNKEIFLKIHHRENLWKRVEDIVANGRDPVRLFNNRGCVLLKEENKRTRVVKELPKVEHQLKELLNEFERTHGQILPINGQDYRQVIVDRWIAYEEQKENEKAQRRERANKLVEEAKGGAKPNTPMKRRLGTTSKENPRMVPTARSTPKQKLPFLQ